MPSKGRRSKSEIRHLMHCPMLTEFHPPSPPEIGWLCDEAQDKLMRDGPRATDE